MSLDQEVSDSQAQQPTIVDNFVPPKENFDGETDTQGPREQDWELERDLAPLQEWQLGEDKKITQSSQRSRATSRKRDIEHDSVIGALCAWIVEHQVGITLDLLAFLALTHTLFPRIRPWTTKFVQLSYFDASSGQFRSGWDDMYIVFFWVVVFTGLRVAIMDHLLQPIARAGGIRNRRKRIRFAEQGWLVVYYTASCSVGFYIWKQQPYWHDFTEFWTDFPVARIDRLTKWYYLVQFGFWLQQIVVVNIEERRNDYAQMFTHHIFTSTLLLTSYGFYQTRVGNVILSIMDVVDPLLSLAKCLRYLGFRVACDCTFVVFLVSWFFFRHVVYNFVCWSVLVDLPKALFPGCYDALSGQTLTPDVSEYPFGNSILSNIMKGWNDPTGVVCYNVKMKYFFLALLLGLQVITLIWFGMIVRVAWRVITGRGADDSRSDDEGSDEEPQTRLKSKELQTAPASTQKTAKVTLQRVSSASSKNGNIRSISPSIASLKPIEREAEVDELYLTRRKSSPRMIGRKRSAGGRTSAISIPGHSDPKDILNRIGCETKTTDQD